MSILCDKNTKLLVQGMGRMRQFHANLSQEYGTQVVAGVAPGKGGQEIGGLPVFDTVAAAKEATGANPFSSELLAVLAEFAEAEPPHAE